ncbi:MAG: bifunctional folylpolyglutamate synthase/dihydrofolate synthase [Desulfuromonadales bacterium]|nr:bifunctional folylpolyglutamate synthase/dihydrofolate synthase [Desulfuromonadales bacterium]
MPLERMLKKLYARRRFGIRPGVERVRLLLDRLGNPEQSFRTVHIVGTNGKGSTSAFLASILTAGGLRTALFTSPHLVSFSERLRIDGREISQERLEPLLNTVLAAAPEEATFFEIVTALAALYFSEEGVDIAVFEAGMGGRSDATAALPGIMTLITPISLDHCDYLGATLAAIAAEKAGIAKAKTPVIIAPQPEEVRQAILGCFPPDRSQLVWTDTAVSASWNSDGTLDYRGLPAVLKGLAPGIRGRYQSENAVLALAAAESLALTGINLPESALRRGISAASWPGRMETIPGHPPLLLDGAHNPAGALALAEALADYRYRKLLLVLGTMADKDVQKIVSALAPLAATCYCVTPAIDRALDDTKLAAISTGMGIPSVACGSVGNGIAAAQRDAGDGDLILVCGSLFTVGEAKAWLTGTEFDGVRG